MWHAGGRPGRLAEKHCVSPLYQKQQVNHLVFWQFVKETDNEVRMTTAVCHWDLPFTSGEDSLNPWEVMGLKSFALKKLAKTPGYQEATHVLIAWIYHHIRVTNN